MVSHVMGSGMVNPAMDLMYDLMHSFLPCPPVSLAASLSANSLSPGGGSKDRLSALLDTILHNVVSHLLAKDAARTTVISLRWRLLCRLASSNRSAARTHRCSGSGCDSVTWAARSRRAPRSSSFDQGSHRRRPHPALPRGSP